MLVKSVIATMARGVALAGFLLSLIGGSEAVLGGVPVALKGVTLRGLDNERIKLAASAGGVTVLVFYSSECPISNAYSPTLQELVGKYRQRPVEWLGICVDPDLSDSEVKTHAHDFKLGFRIARDQFAHFLVRKIGRPSHPRRSSWMTKARSAITGESTTNSSRAASGTPHRAEAS